MNETNTKNFSGIVINEVLPAIAKAYCAVGLEQQKYANLTGRKELAESLVKGRTEYLSAVIGKYIEGQEALWLSLVDQKTLLKMARKK